MTFLVSVNVLDTESFIALYIAMGALFFNDPIRNLISLMFMDIPTAYMSSYHMHVVSTEVRRASHLLEPELCGYWKSNQGPLQSSKCS